MSIAITVLLVLLAFACFLSAWRGLNERTNTLNAMGERYGMKRWEGESNDDFADRIRARLDITGGKGKRW